MTIELLLFLVLAAVAITTALGMLLSKNAVYSALFLVLNLVTVAVFYLLLSAPFIAMAQITVYAGAIMVLFLFVIMLVSIERSVKEEQFNRQWHVGALAALVMGGLFVLVFWKGRAVFPRTMTQFVENTNTQDVGLLLYRNYMLPFEIASLLLLVAIVGAVVMAKKRI